MEELFFALLGLATIGAFFAPLILSLVAMSRTGELKRKLARLEARLAAFDQARPPAPVPEAPVAPVEAIVTVPEPLR